MVSRERHGCDERNIKKMCLIEPASGELGINQQFQIAGKEKAQ
jgi:hypothetical protein